MTTDSTTTQTTAPAFEALLAQAKQIFNDYDGPDTWEEEGVAICFDLFAAARRTGEAAAVAVIWLIAQEGSWYQIEPFIESVATAMMGDSFKSAGFYLEGLILGKRQLPTTTQRIAFWVAWLTTEDGVKFREEVIEALGDALEADPEVKAESDRRYALTGNPAD